MLVGLLVATTIVVDVVAMAVVDSTFPGRESLVYHFLVGLTLSQPSLLAIWVAMGRKGPLWRCSAIVAVIVGWSVAWRARFAANALEVGVALLVQAGFIIGVLGLARLVGAGVVCATEAGRALSPRKFQFTLRQLLVLMTLLAIAMGLIRWFGPPEAPSVLRRWRSVLELGAFTGSGAAVTLAALWAALGVGWPALRLLFLASIVAAAVTGLAYLLPASASRDLWVLLASQSLLVFVSLLVVRMAGYRLAWRAGRRP
jgi:hypothetical protein